MSQTGLSETPPVFVYDMRKKGWVLQSNTSRRITQAADLELVSPNDDEMRYWRRQRSRPLIQALWKVNCGQEDAEWLLAHQGQIPVEFRNHYLLCPGTIWQQGPPPGIPITPYLYWSRWNRCWHLGFGALTGYDYSFSYRLLRPRYRARA